MHIPGHTFDDVLLAQEMAEDDQLQARATNLWRESQIRSCAEDNETTPWLQHTKWPERFQNQPLDVISASTKLPARGPYERQKSLMLGNWHGATVQSSAASEGRLRILMQTVDDMFDRAEASLAHTSYQSRCWLTSYGQAMFRNRPLRIMAPKTAYHYKSKWKHLMCYVFRAFELGPQKCREIHNMPLRGNDRKMMNHVLDLIAQISEQEEDEDEDEDDENDEADEDSEDSEDSDSEDDEDGEESGEDDDEGDESSSERGIIKQSPDAKSCDGQSKRIVNKSNCSGSRKAEENEDNGYRLELTADQSNFTLPRGKRLELSEALFQLSVMFWTYQSQDGVMDSSTIVHFTAVLGIHRSSLVYRDAYNFTPDLAALIWVGRLLFLEYSLPFYSYETLMCPWPARHTYPSQPNRLEAIRKKYMVRECYSPLRELIELKALGKSIVRREGPRGTLTWAPDGRSFTLGKNKTIRLSEFCTIFRASVQKFQDHVAEMMLGWAPTIDLSAIHDDLTCQLPGWSFLNMPENQLLGAYKKMSRRAWTSVFRGKPLAKAGHWLPDSCQGYLRAGDELCTAGFSAFHITSGLPARGQEMTTIRFRNTEGGHPWRQSADNHQLY